MLRKLHYISYVLHFVTHTFPLLFSIIINILVALVQKPLMYLVSGKGMDIMETINLSSKKSWQKMHSKSYQDWCMLQPQNKYILLYLKMLAKTLVRTLQREKFLP